MNTPTKDPNSDVIQALASLRPVAPRSQQDVVEGKQRFLSEVAKIRAEKPTQAVSVPTFWRLIEWIKTKSRKGYMAMNTALSITLVVALMLGGAGASVAAAQDSLPGQPFYSIKLAAEDVQLDLASTPQDEVYLQIAFAERRTAEIATLAGQSQDVPAQVQDRLQFHIDRSLELSAGFGEQELQGALEQEQLALQNQLQVLEQVQARAGSPAEAALVQARQTVRTRLGWVNEGLSDPNLFRLRIRQGAGLDQPQPHTPSPNTGGGNAGTPNGSHATGTCTSTPGASYGPGPQHTPAGENHSYGPGPGSGPGPQATPDPGNGYGPGPQATSGSHSGEGPGPQATGAPGGPGHPDSTHQVTPQQDGNGGAGNGAGGNEGAAGSEGAAGGSGGDNTGSDTDNGAGDSGGGDISGDGAGTSGSREGGGGDSGSGNGGGNGGGGN